MVTTFYPPYHSGGDAVAIQRLVRALTARGHHVEVVHDVDAHRAVHGDVVRPSEPEPAGVVVHALKSRLGALSPLLTQQFGFPVLQGRRIREILDDGRFDVVHFHNVSLVGGPGVLSYGSGVRIYTAHEHWLVCPTHILWRHGREPCDARQCLRCVLLHRRPPQLWRYTGALARAARSVDAFLAMSEFSRRRHLDFGFPHDMEVLPGFVQDVAPERSAGEESPHPRPYFLFAGRLLRMKGLDDVIPRFHGDGPSDLLIAGEGPHAGALRELAAGAPRVRFLGTVDRAALSRLYRGALATLVPSVGLETFGLVTIEALAEGCPVVARRVGPLPEVIDASGAGDLFDSAEDLGALLRAYEADPGRRERLGRAGRDAVRRLWSEDAVIPRYLAIVRGAAARRGLGRVVDELR